MDLRVDALAASQLLTAPPAALVDPVRQRRARAIVDYRELIAAGGALAPVVAFFALWNSGLSARTRDVLRRRLRAPALYRAAFGAVLGGIIAAAQLPFAFAAYRLDSSVGLTEQSIAGWALDELGRVAVSVLVVAILVVVVLELVDRTRLWYVAFIVFLYAAAIAVVSVEPALVAPLATAQRPAPAAIVADGDAIARALHSAPVPIEIASASSRSSQLEARTTGVGPFARIVLGDLTVARLSPGELRYVLAREYAYVVGHGVLLLTLIATTLFIVAAALAVLISDRIGFRRDDDPLARLALVGTFLGLAAIVLFPGFNAIERGVERRADRLALDVTHEPADAVRFFARHAADDLVPLCDRRTTRWYFAQQPALGARIAEARGTENPCPR